MPSAGPNNAGTCVDDATVGTISWANPTFAQGPINASYSTATSTVGPLRVSHFLKATNFGFAVPAASTITGIQVCMQRRMSGPSCTDNIIQTVQGGIIGGANRSAGALWPPFASPALDCFGGPGDLWGRAWTPALINAVGFGAAVSANLLNFSGAQVDAWQITVFFAMAGNPNILSLCACCGVLNGGEVDMSP